MPSLPISGISGLSLRGVHRAGMDRNQPEAAFLVEAKRVQVVVGGDQPQPPAAGRAGAALTASTSDVPMPWFGMQAVQRNDLARVPGDVEGDQPSGHPIRLSDEAGQLAG